MVIMIDGVVKFYLEESASILSPRRSHKHFTLHLLENTKFICKLAIFATRTYTILLSPETIVHSSETNSRTQLSCGHMFSVTGLYDTLYFRDIIAPFNPLYYAYLYQLQFEQHFMSSKL